MSVTVMACLESMGEAILKLERRIDKLEKENSDMTIVINTNSSKINEVDVEVLSKVIKRVLEGVVKRYV